MSRTGFKEIYGTDADLLLHCKRRGRITPLPALFLDFLNEYECAPDVAFPEHRDHLSSGEWKLLVNWLGWRFGYKTFEEPLPPLQYWARVLHFARSHLWKMWQFLASQGLILVWSDVRPGGALHFSLEPLLNRIRVWLGIKPKAQPVPEPEPVEPWAVLEGEKEPIPFPVPEPEPQPVPEAAMVAAPEWQTIKEQALARTPKGAHHWFDSAVAYRADDSFIIVVQSRTQGRQLSTRFHDLLMSLIEKYCAWCQFVRYDVAARSAS